jgi:predicted NAD/FAD-dependent oxidoreductase
MRTYRIAIVGAGLSGLTAASILQQHGFDIQIFEKSRGCGGRMATRRSSGFEFDHGAQYFTVRHPTFRVVVDSWIRDEVAALWEGRIAVLENGQLRFKSEQTQRYVGTPRMNSVVRHLARGIQIDFETRVTGLDKQESHWYLMAEQTVCSGSFDAVILTIPSPQAAELLGDRSFSDPRMQTTMYPCWAVMAAFERRLDLPFEGAFVNHSAISWISRNSSKPERGDQECWVLHGSPEWSRDFIEASQDWAAENILASFFAETGIKRNEPSWLKAHRWRFAQAAEPETQGCFWNSKERLGICGDWCSGSRVEGAFLSGRAIAEQVLQSA